MKQNPATRFLAGVTALGLSLFGMTGCSEKPAPDPTESQSSSVVEPDSGEGENLSRYDGLKIACPKLSTASDAFLLTTPCSAVLIDTGEDIHARKVLKLLKENSVSTLDALILTHFDRDHIGGAAAVLDSVQVNTLYRTTFEGDNQPYFALLEALERNPETNVVTLTDTAALELGDVTYTLYPPMECAYSKDEDNNSSIITAVSYGEGPLNLLFAGDAEKTRIKEFLSKQYDGTQYDFMKIPHHGRDPKPMKKLLKQFIPDHAIITSSAGEPESDSLMSRLEEAGTEVWLTREGDITILCDGKDMNVLQEQ